MPGDGQGLPGLILVRCGSQAFRCRNHGRKQAFNQPPSQATSHKGQQQRGQQDAALDRAYRSEGLLGGQRDHQEPVSRPDSCGRSQYLDALRVGANGCPGVTPKKMIHHRVDSRGRHGLHGAAFVGGGDDHPVLRCEQRIATGLSVTDFHQFFQKVCLSQVGNSCDGPDDLTLSIPNGSCHSHNGGLQFLADDRSADGGFAPTDRFNDVVPVEVTDTGCSGRRRDRSNGHTIKPGNKGATIEGALKYRLTFQNLLQGKRTLHGGRMDYGCDLLKRLKAVAHFVLELGGYQCGRRRLLLAQQILHLLTQDLAAVERQRPDADHKDEEREKRHPGLE